MNAHPTDDRRPLIQNAGEGQRFAIDGMIISVKAAETAQVGGLTLYEIALPPHLSGPAPHVHRQTTEWFYILSGALAFTLNDETVMARSGSSLLIPPGLVHTFWNPTASPATLLGMRTQADFADYLTVLVGLMAAKPLASLEQFAALAAQYDQFPPDNGPIGTL